MLDTWGQVLSFSVCGMNQYQFQIHGNYTIIEFLTMFMFLKMFFAKNVLAQAKNVDNFDIFYKGCTCNPLRSVHEYNFSSFIQRTLYYRLNIQVYPVASSYKRKNIFGFPIKY